MIPHNMPLFKFICALYQFHHQTLPIMKIDRGQIQFRDYVFTGTEPYMLRNMTTDKKILTYNDHGHIIFISKQLK